MEYARGAGAYLSHPKYWQQVLKRHGTLRLCLGHAGGEVAWFGPDDEKYADWRKPVVELCLKHEGVFCEFGPLDGDYKPKWIDRFKNRLSSLAANPATAPFMNKICFGSDYHLLLRHDNAGEYRTFFQQIFQDQRLACFADRFFDRNARAWLGLQDPTPRRASPLSSPLVVPTDSAGVACLAASQIVGRRECSRLSPEPSALGSLDDACHPDDPAVVEQILRRLKAALNRLPARIAGSVATLGGRGADGAQAHPPPNPYQALGLVGR